MLHHIFWWHVSTSTAQSYLDPSSHRKAFSSDVVKICKLTSLRGNIKNVILWRVESLQSKSFFLFAIQILSGKKIMERRLAVDVAAVDNSNDSGCNWKPSISEQHHITLLALDWTQGNAQMGNMGNNCFMWRQIRLSLLSISLSHSPPHPSLPKWGMQMQSYSSTYWSPWIHATALIKEMYTQGNVPHLKWNAFNLCAVVFSATFFFFALFVLIVKSRCFSEIRYCKRWQLQEQNWQAWQSQQ